MSLVIPGSARPSNLHLRPDQLRMEVQGDVYDICDRIATEVEGGDRLYIVVHEDHPKPYVVMEHADNGTDMYVLRTDTLDGRLISHLQYLVRVPLARRLEEFEKLEAQRKKDYREEQHEGLYEKLGGPMHSQLARDGFTDGFGHSYPKRPKRKG